MKLYLHLSNGFTILENVDEYRLTQYKQDDDVINKFHGRFSSKEEIANMVICDGSSEIFTLAHSEINGRHHITAFNCPCSQIAD